MDGETNGLVGEIAAVIIPFSGPTQYPELAVKAQMPSSLSPRLALLTVATAQAQPGCLPCWPRALGPSKYRCAKKEKQRRRSKKPREGVPGVVLGEADETMRWCWSTPVVCILQSNHFLSCPLFFFPPCSFPTRSQKRPAKLSWWSFRLQAGELAHV